MESVGLAIAGRKWTGWTSVDVDRALDQAAGAFELSLTTRQAADPVPLDLVPNVRCVLYAGYDPLLDGVIDSVHVSESDKDLTVSVTGRSRTARLIKNSIRASAGELRGLTVLQIARKLAKPYDVDVVLSPGVDEGPAVDCVLLQPGESVFESIERICRERGFLLTDNASGQLVLTRVNTEAWASPLIYGVAPVLSWDYTADASERYTEYRVVGQRAGSDAAFGRDVSRCLGVAYDRQWTTDTNILTIRAEGQADNAACQRRAEWEAAVRAGKATQLTVRVHGWRMGDGRLWQPNLLTHVGYPRARVDRNLLIASVRLGQTEEGEIAELGLSPPCAFTPEPLKRKDLKAVQDGVGTSGLWVEDWGVER